jgi:two-component system KDP operon response regulator KdpE
MQCQTYSALTIDSGICLIERGGAILSHIQAQNQRCILVVEDDAAVRSLITTALKLQSYKILQVQTGNQALLQASSHHPDMMVLDLGLPDIDGIVIIHRVREWSDMPIIVVSARLDDADKINALDSGADDYLIKPFSVDELLARVRVALRRVEKAESSNQDVTYYNGDLIIRYEEGVVTLGDKEIHLTPMEYRLICLLARNTGKVLTYNFILKELWGAPQACDMSSLRVCMATLRKKIEKDSGNPRYIQTHVGIGYRMMRVEE